MATWVFLNPGRPFLLGEAVLSKLAEFPARYLIDQIKSKQLTSKILPRGTRMEIVRVLEFDDRMTHAEIASLLGISDRTVRNDLARIDLEEVHPLKSVSRDRLAGEVFRNARMMISWAYRKNEFDLAWTIQKELIEVLQSLGYVYKAPEKNELSGPGGGPIPQIVLESPKEFTDSRLKMPRFELEDPKQPAGTHENGNSF